MPSQSGKFDSQLAKAVTALSRINCAAEDNFVFLPPFCQAGFTFYRSRKSKKEMAYMFLHGDV